MKAQMYNYANWIRETDPAVLLETFTAQLTAAGFGICSVAEKHFSPHGYTAVFLLSESHFAIHTFPEEGQAYIELTSCVKGPFDAFINLSKTK